MGRKRELPPAYEAVQVTRSFFSEEAVRQILAKSGVSLRGDPNTKLGQLTEELEWAAQVYDDLKHIKTALQPAEALQILKETHACASRLLELLSRLKDHPTIWQLSLSQYSWYSSLCNHLPVLIEETELVLGVRTRSEDEEAKNREERKRLPSPKKGRPPESPRTNFIYRLAEAYEAHTGRKAGRSRYSSAHESKPGEPTGPFFRFVDACLRHIGAPEQPSTLIKAIEETNSLRKKRQPSS
jgi:hypothetical protein